MTSLMPGHSEKAARLMAVQAKGTLVKGKAQSAPQKEPGMKKEEVEITESDDLGPVKKKQKTVMLVHKTSGREKVVVDTPKNREDNAKIGFHPMKKEEVELDEGQSHQARTTMKHIVNPTPGEKRAAKDIKPGIAGYRDRVAMLKSAEARGALKKEEAEQIDELSKTTLGSYVKKAAFDMGQKGISAGQSDKKSEWLKTAKKMNKRTDSIIKATDRLTKEEVEQVDERTLSSGEMEKREKYVKSMKKGLEGFKQRYGERAKEVMYATATKMAKKD